MSIRVFGDTNPIFQDWMHLRLCLSGKKDGIAWYIGEYNMPISDQQMVVRLAYVDVTSTKLDGITDTSYIDSLGINFYGGCTFAGAGENIALFRKIGTKNEKNHWFLGEDYAHNLFVRQSPIFSVEKIAEHLELETIPSIFKTLVFLDVEGSDNSYIE